MEGGANAGSGDSAPDAPIPPSASLSARRPVSLLTLNIIVTVCAALLIAALRTTVPDDPSWRRRSSANYLKQMGLILMMYSSEQGRLPPLTRYGKLWVPDLETLYPEYLTDLSILVNPRSDFGYEMHIEMERLAKQNSLDWEGITRLAAGNFVYLPWEVHSEEEADTVARFVAENNDAVRARLGTLRIHGNEYVSHAMRIEDRQKTDISSNIVMFEMGHLPGVEQGVNVLYGDGHVEFVRKEAGFPATPTTAALFANNQLSESVIRTFGLLHRRNELVRLAANIAALSPLILGALLLLLGVFRRIPMTIPFAVLALCPTAMTIATDITPLPLRIPHPFALILAAFVVCIVLYFHMAHEYLDNLGAQTKARQRARWIQIAFLVLWILMIYFSTFGRLFFGFRELA